MKSFFSTALAILLFLVSCNQDDTNNVPNPSYFTINGTTYQVISVQGAGGIFTASGSHSADVGSVAVYFYNNVLPTTNGTYNISDSANGSNNIYVTASTNSGGTTKTYTSFDTATQSKAAVTVNKGKLTIQFSDVAMQDGSGNTIKLSATLKQD